jgi:hypothetical protein
MLITGISYANIPKTQHFHQKVESTPHHVFAQLFPALSINTHVFVHSEIQDRQENLFFDTEGKEKSYKKQKAVKPLLSKYNSSKGCIFHTCFALLVVKKSHEFLYQYQFCIPTQDLFIQYNALII